MYYNWKLNANLAQVIEKNHWGKTTFILQDIALVNYCSL